MDFGHWLSGAAGRQPDRVAVAAPGRIDHLPRAAAAWRARRRRAARPRGQARPSDRPGAGARAAVRRGAARRAAARRAGGAGRPAPQRARAPPADARPRGGDRAPARHESGVFQLPEPPPGDDVALVVPTSGTTGRPKPVEITFGNIPPTPAASRWRSGSTGDERWLCPMPLAHVGGLMVLLRSRSMATTAVLAPPPFDAADVATQLRDGGITIASLVPTQLQRLLDAGAAPGPRLRPSCSAAGRCRAALLARARAAGFPSARATGSRRPARPSPWPSRATSRPRAGRCRAWRRDRRRRRDPRLGRP